MKQTDKLSIIIPAYNAEAYIGRCLDSILDQDYHNEVEIIVVNDGSTDLTAKVIDVYQSRYPNIIRIMTQKNGGVCAARNKGLDSVTGEWVWFCDADDYICKNGLSYVLDHFVDNDIDVCTFCSISFDSYTLKSFKEPEQVVGKCTFEGTTKSKLKRSFPGSVCDHLFRVSALGNTRFRDMPIGEDVLFDIEMYMKDLRIRCTNTNIYRYTINDGQATRKRDPVAMRKAVRGYDSIFDIVQQYKNSVSDDVELSRSFDQWIANAFTPYISRILSSNLSKKEFIEIVHRLKRKGIIPILETNKKHKVYNFICKYPQLYPIESYLHQHLFVRYILPKLSRN